MAEPGTQKNRTGINQIPVPKQAPRGVVSSLSSGPTELRNPVQSSPIGRFQKQKQIKEFESATSIPIQSVFKSRKNNTSDTKSGEGSKTSSPGWGVMGAATDMISSIIPDNGKNTAFKEQQQLGNALMTVNPMVGAIYKAASIVGELTGTNVSKMSQDQATAAGIDGATRFLNNLHAYIPGTGILGTTLNAEKSHLIDEMAGGYGGTVDDINVSETMGNQNYLFGKQKANRFIRDMNDKNKLLTDINQTNTLRKQSDYGTDLAQQNLNRYAGTNYSNIYLGRSGMKFAELNEVRLMLANRKQTETSNVEKFANGGTVYPKGVLHKELHHITDTAPELEGKITRKGIPVIALDETGEIQQIAEIERNEICLSKEITDQIEELREIGDDDAMRRAGKLIVNEIKTLCLI